jgi:hypothetical protein
MAWQRLKKPVIMEAREPGPTMQYKARWGFHVKLMTFWCTILCFGIPIWYSANGGVPGDLFLACLMRAPLLVWLACLLLSVRGYTITDDSILIHRLVWNTRLPLEEVTEINFDPEIYYRSFRYFSTDGIFGVSGVHYAQNEGGAFHAFLTDTTKTVLLKFSSRSILVSPPDPQEFVKALLRQTEQFSASEETRIAA